MNSTTCLLLLPFLACLLGIWLLRKRRVQQNLPGPGNYFMGSIANGLALRNRKTTLSVIESWTRSYGPVIRINFFFKSVIILNSPDYIQKLLGSTDMNYHGKGFIYKPLRPVWKDGVIISTGEKWKLRRKLLKKHIFSYKTLPGFMKIFNEEANVLVNTLRETSCGKEMEIDGLVKNYILTCITKAIVGVSPSALALDTEDVSLTKLISKMKEIISKRAFEPWLLFDPIWQWHPLSKVEDTLSKIGWRQARVAIADTSGNGVKNLPNLMEELLAAGVPIEGICEEIMTLISAGYETTEAALQFLLFMLALHPHHQQMCREEVEALFPNDDDAINIELRDLDKLKHLEMCLDETLRLFPIVFLIMRKITAPLQLAKDLEIDTGTDVAIYLPGIHRDPKLFPNPNDFIPERFSEERSKDRHPYAFIPFTAGPRKCMGYKFAKIDTICLAAKLIRYFHISTLDKFEDIVMLPYITLTLEKPIKFIFGSRRTKNLADLNN